MVVRGRQVMVAELPQFADAFATEGSHYARTRYQRCRCGAAMRWVRQTRRRRPLGRVHSGLEQCESGRLGDPPSQRAMGAPLPLLREPRQRLTRAAVSSLLTFPF